MYEVCNIYITTLTQCITYCILWALLIFASYRKVFVVRQPLLLTILILSGLISATAWCYQKEQVFSIPEPRSYAREVERAPDPKDPCLPDLRTRVPERTFKANMIALRIRDPKKFEEDRKDTLENSPLYQSWMDEVNEAMKGKNISPKLATLSNDELYRRFFDGSPVDLAKKIAKRQMVMNVQRNWSFLKESIFNDIGADTWCPPPPAKKKGLAEGPMDDPDRPFGVRVTADRLNELLLYSTRYSRVARSYVFTFDFGGPNFVEVDSRTLRNGRTGVDISSSHDDNHLEDGAENIRTDSGSGGNGGSGGSTAPAQEAPKF
jgi:hypothetical protein